jgi:hypothetical protein
MRDRIATTVKTLANNLRTTCEKKCKPDSTRTILTVNRHSHLSKGHVPACAQDNFIQLAFNSFRLFQLLLISPLGERQVSPAGKWSPFITTSPCWYYGTTGHLRCRLIRHRGISAPGPIYFAPDTLHCIENI